jgi:hypothetical protein
MYKIAVVINDASINANITMNIDVSIRPEVQTHFFTVYVPYENNINIMANTKNETNDIKLLKNKNENNAKSGES